MFEIKPEDVCEGSSNNKEEFHFTNYSAKSKYCDNSNKLVIRKIKDENAGVAVKKFVGLKPKIYSFLVDDNSKHVKSKRLE